MRIARFCRYLPEHGVLPTVLTVEEKYYDKHDDSIESPPGIEVVRTPVFPIPFNFGHDRKSEVKTGRRPLRSVKLRGPHSPLVFARQQILALSQAPDRFWGWYFAATRKGAQIINDRGMSVIISSGPPWTCHLIARYLKRRFRIPWIADFRDPWVANPWRNLPCWRNRLDRSLESSCLRDADLVTCVTGALRDDFITRYPQLPQSRFAILSNGVDDAPQSSGTVLSKPSKIMLLHLGELYTTSERRIDTFCQAVVDLVESGKLDPTKFQILFVGSESPSSEIVAETIARELVRNRCIEFRERVTRQECEHLLDQADILLLFQGNHRISLPSKFFDYLRTGKPMLAIVENGALSDLVDKTESGLWVSPGDSTAIATRILEVLKLSAKSREEIDRLVSRFHFRKLAGQLAELARGLATPVLH